MLSYYLTLKLLHLSLVIISGTLFVLRGAGVLAAQDWPMRPVARRASVAIDTLLLSAGVTMWVLLSWHPVQHPWLGTKLLLLLLYIVLGSLALKRARRPGQRAVFFVAALAVYGFMASVAVAHHPLGLLRGLVGGA
ncbi:MAG: regulator SirB [Burkholderiales bacterium RIFCSPHIGHO2_12_FULL_69_20]|nr:MAG: regulator SirB [Burkholderiales bacterium RIFCSPHIGHO2_12_FULL_69_20]